MSTANDRPTAETWSVGRIIEWTTQHLKKHGSESPRLDAEILLAHARGCPRIQLYVQFAEPVSESQRAQMRELVTRRAKAEPVAYLVGHREFYGLDFRVTPEVLIPRPETETLVLELITAGRKRGARSAAHGAEGSEPAATGEEAAGNPQLRAGLLRILDVGTGSGCIAVSAAVNLPEAEVTAIDVSLGALAVARGNAAAHRVAERIRFLEGDLFAPLEESAEFDFVASNAPYVSDAELETLSPDVRLHEPHRALRGGPQGLDVIARLIAEAPPYLAPDGMLLLEIAPEQAAAVEGLIAAQPALEGPRFLKDPSGNVRVVTATRRSA